MSQPWALAPDAANQMGTRRGYFEVDTRYFVQGSNFMVEFTSSKSALKWQDLHSF